MKFENTFEVDAPIDEVYATLLDVERVAPCVPGAEVIEKSGDNAYTVAIKVRVGPISMTYRGNVEIVERDDANHRAVMRARARETRGQGTADAASTLTLVQEGRRRRARWPPTSSSPAAPRRWAAGSSRTCRRRSSRRSPTNLEAMLGGGGRGPGRRPAAAPHAPEPATADAAEARGGPAPRPAAAPRPRRDHAAPPGPPPRPAPPPPPPPPRPRRRRRRRAAGRADRRRGLVGRLQGPEGAGRDRASPSPFSAVCARRNR